MDAHTEERRIGLLTDIDRFLRCLCHKGLRGQTSATTVNVRSMEMYDKAKFIKTTDVGVQATEDPLAEEPKFTAKRFTSSNKLTRPSSPLDDCRPCTGANKKDKLSYANTSGLRISTHILGKEKASIKCFSPHWIDTPYHGPLGNASPTRRDRREPVITLGGNGTYKSRPDAVKGSMCL